MRKQLITQEEGEAALREHGVASVEETELVVLEGDGSLSVTHNIGRFVEQPAVAS